MKFSKARAIAIFAENGHHFFAGQLAPAKLVFRPIKQPQSLHLWACPDPVKWEQFSQIFFLFFAISVSASICPVSAACLITFVAVSAAFFAFVLTSVMLLLKLPQQDMSFSRVKFEQ